MKTTRNTIAKTKIRELITSSAVALSHSEIQNKLSGLCDRVTIYRVLERLTTEGIVHKIVNIDGVIKYSKCHSCTKEHQHNHVHFSCEKCKSVICLDDVIPEYKLPKNYKVTQTNFTIAGICPKCS